MIIIHPPTHSEARDSKGNRSSDDARECRRQLQGDGTVLGRRRASRASRAAVGCCGRAGRAGAGVRPNDVGRGRLLVHVVQRVLHATADGLQLYQNIIQ